MKTYGGLAFHFLEPEHRETIKSRLEKGLYFTDNISKRDLNPAAAEICLLSFDGENLSHICLARTTRMGVTGRMTLKFSRCRNLNHISITTLEEFSGLRHFIGRLLAKPVTRIEGADWNALLDAIKLLRPELATSLDEYEKHRLLVGTPTEQVAIKTIAQERDATRLALECFGLEKEDIRAALEFELPPEPAPFLKGLKAVKLREDPMIDHDARLVTDFGEMRSLIQGSIVYTKGNERLTVLNVNRAGVERAIGVDLIYYTHRYKSYVMVQYKRLHKVPSDWVFSLNDKQFEADLTRMKAFNLEYPSSGFTGEPLDYRLNDQHFYFKFCKDVSYEPLDSSMIDGMYLPLEYLQSLKDSPLTKGHRGGCILGYENTVRHLNNSDFIRLVRGGWIGSRTNTTAVVTELVRTCIDADHSVIVGLNQKEAESPSFHF